MAGGHIGNRLAYERTHGHELCRLLSKPACTLIKFVLSDKSPRLAHLPSGNCDTTDSSTKIEAQKILMACTVTMRYIDDGHATINPYLQCLITIHKYTWAFTVSTHAASTYGILALEDEALSVNFPELRTFSTLFCAQLHS